MMVGYILGLTAVVVVLWLGFGVRRIGAISRGVPIGNRSGTALLLIDLQSVFWDDGPYSDASKSAAEAAIVREINAAKAQGYPVIAVRQEWSIPSTKAVARLTMKGQALEGTPGTQLAVPFAGRADHFLVKRVQDAFETGELDALLAQLGVGRLRLAGLDFNYCVLKTALAAQNRGYEVTIATEGTLAAASTAQARARLARHAVALD